MLNIGRMNAETQKRTASHNMKQHSVPSEAAEPPERGAHTVDKRTRSRGTGVLQIADFPDACGIVKPERFECALGPRAEKPCGGDETARRKPGIPES
jgi:hypothetical protein